MKEQRDSPTQGARRRFFNRLSLSAAGKLRLKILWWFLLPAVVLLCVFFALVQILRNFPIPMQYVEIAWTCITGMGFGISFWASGDALRDVEVVEQRPATTPAAQGRHIVAWASAWRAVSCVYILALFFAAGLITLSGPARPGDLTTTRSLFGLLVIVALLLAAASFTFMAIFERRDRQYLLRVMRRKAGTPHETSP